MKLAILLPGYLDSPDYLHIKVISTGLQKIGYTTKALDPGGLWKTNDAENYTITNYLKDIKDVIDTYKDKQPEEIVLIGHSLGGFVAILAGYMNPEVTKIVSLCSRNSTDNMGNKWVDNKPRISKRDLPEDPENFRFFEIPVSFVDDAKKYSVIDKLKDLNKPLMILIGMKDTSIPPEETEVLVKNAINPYVVRIPNIGHNFRRSKVESELVMSKIEKFLS